MRKILDTIKFTGIFYPSVSFDSLPGDTIYAALSPFRSPLFALAIIQRELLNKRT